MLEEELRDLGLTEKQALVFTATLESGKTTPAKIAQATGINRTTVYSVAKELAEKGYILEDTLKGTTYLYPASPKDLIKITKRERQALVEKELKMEALAKSIAALPQSKKYAVPKLRFVEHEERVVEYLYEKTLTWDSGRSGDDAVWYGFQDITFVEHEPYREWIRWYWPRASEHTELKLFTNDTAAESEVKDVTNRRQFKQWSKSFHFDATQWVVGDYTVIIMTKQKPHYLVELHDAVYADNMRKLFKNLWEEIR